VWSKVGWFVEGLHLVGGSYHYFYRYVPDDALNMFCISVYYNDHAFCCAFGLMYFPWIIYVKNDSYAYSGLKCISLLKRMRLIMNENVLFRVVTPTW
jgi:hypothetical protein